MAFDGHLLLQLALGFAAGFFSGLLGIGGGQILIPGMTMLFGVGQRAAQGISLAFIVPTTIAGAYTHYRQGTGVPRAAMQIIPGALVGGVLGSTAAQFLPVRGLQLAFASFLFYMGLRMIRPTIYREILSKLKGMR